MPGFPDGGVRREIMSILLQQKLYADRQEDEAKRKKPTMKGVSEPVESSKPSEQETKKPANNVQVPEEGKLVDEGDPEGKEPTRRRSDAKMLDMQWKLDTFHIPKGKWIYMSKSHTEEEMVGDWIRFEEDHQNATF